MQYVDQERAPTNDRLITAPDGVFNYASAVLNDGLLYLEFIDAIREGDGKRTLTCWKNLLLYFFSAKHYNYVKEAVYLLANINAAVSPKVAAQMTWSRFVNTKGRKGCNIPVDLHNEHLNRGTLKEAISAVGANVNANTIAQCGKSLKGIIDVGTQFDRQQNIRKTSSEHSKASIANDEKTIIEELLTNRIYEYIPGRHHSSYKDIKPCISMTLNFDKLTETIKKHRH